MKKARPLLRWVVILITLVTVTICVGGIGAFGSVHQTGNDVDVRADIISIDSMKVFGKLERPAVTFLHQKHSEALDKKNKECSTCHLSDDKRLSTSYLRLKDTTRQEVMDIYHINCVACHKETEDAGEKSGPVICGECHTDKPTVISSWQPLGMDKSLHYRHVKANQEKCERCHHEYNAVSKKLFYAEGKEGTCRYCHRDETEDNRISLQLAAHIACIDCHRKTLAKNESAGPFMCGGCHDPAQQKLIEVVKDLPRMKRNQPDFVFVKTAKSEEEKANPLTRMKRVPFNHKAHESYNDTCRVCHHADLNACVQCHTLQGAKDGDYVKLEQSMHRQNIAHSCIGCHESRQTLQPCAGCHRSFEKKQQQDQLSCQNCHMAENSREARNPDSKMMAAMVLESREAITATYDNADIPEDVKIDALMHKYEPVKLPHRKIVNTLFNNIKDNKLANYFHYEKGTICQGCHHNSPASKKPPKCASCHGQPFNEKDPFKPGLMAAYHRQCMECHKEMGIRNPVTTNCTACHREKS
ncbi:MAG: hypothetical protein JSV83_16125 [Desulfobacterales bacterium]|nr:MAG: hypothetical protein JSV83_16125 [Desulfobacterales bacterium]